MKHIIIEKLNIQMDLDFNGNFINLVNADNGMLFSLNNSDVSINAYLEKKPTEMDMHQFIAYQIKTLKKMNFQSSKIDFFRKELKNFADVKIGQVLNSKTKFEDTAILLLKKDNVKQLQFFVNFNAYVLIIGLNLLNVQFSTEQELMSCPAVKKMIESVNSIVSID